MVHVPYRLGTLDGVTQVHLLHPALPGKPPAPIPTHPPMAAAAEAAVGRDSRNAAAAAVRQYMTKLVGSMAVDATSMPGLRHRKTSRQCAMAGR